MADTPNLSLPLLQAAQSQKHVTVNEALTRLDALVQLRLQSVTVSAPPMGAPDGQAWGVPAGGEGLWEGKDGRIAVQDNGGWVFVAPLPGWRAYVVDAGADMRWTGSAWAAIGAAVSASGAGIALRVLEFDHVLTPGGAQDTGVVIPSHATVFGVTGRVIEAISGTLSAWRLGADGSDNRFGAGLGLGLNSYVHGVLGSPLTGYAPMPLTLTPEGGDFSGGTVRLAVHFAELTIPASV
ncbi:uncharacterized protein DUF2793 [Rhodovulum kholense]|uniref:Uncharacterized protein DUF2793 n=1 Tax=Rhodovulum kholense TaxID=453584 RepID=A0A8E2VL38_9RHOB|nr:DUF2793 domain-containing protein [Rhodovulum kholense]PTW49899.1 uncharacterized protein DUF2793 [Rhodovulum kholense]